MEIANCKLRLSVPGTFLYRLSHVCSSCHGHIPRKTKQYGQLIVIMIIKIIIK